MLKQAVVGKDVQSSAFEFKEYNRKEANQKRPAFQIKQINSPNCKWYTMPNFELEKIPLMFVPADFQRKISTAHVYRIVESIINNKFFDNTIRTVRLKNGKYEVIDGQHRLQALWILYQQYGIKKYTIVMQYFLENQAREVFRKINSGKKLTNMDHLKTLDEGKTPFFNELREVATHGNQKTKITYYGLLNCLKYARGINSRSVKLNELEQMINNISSDELAYLFRFASASNTCYHQFISTRVFNAGLARPLCKIGFKQNFSIKEYINGLHKIMSREDIEEFLRQPFQTNYLQMQREIEKTLAN